MSEELKVDYNRGSKLAPEVKQRIWCMGLAVVVSCVFGLLASIYITTDVQSNVNHSAQAGARQNCTTIAQSRVTGDEFRFAVREELSFIPGIVASAAKHRENSTTKIFLAQQLKLLNNALGAEKAKLPGLSELLPGTIKGYGDLFPLLADQPLISCTHIGQ